MFDKKILARMIDGREFDLKILLLGLLWCNNFSINLGSLFRTLFIGSIDEMFMSLSIMTRIIK